MRNLDHSRAKAATMKRQAASLVRHAEPTPSSGAACTSPFVTETQVLGAVTL